jgi:hypothetical protein
VLRSAFAIALLAGSVAEPFSTWPVRCLAWALVASILLGAFSRLACALALPLLIWECMQYAMPQDVTGMFVMPSVALAVCLLGPGAFSVDGLRYGRWIYRTGK